MNNFYVRLARWLAIPLVALAVVIVVLVGGGGGGSVPPGAIIRAADVTDHVTGADLAGSITINAAGRNLTMSLTGYESLVRRDGVMTLHLNGFPGLSSSSASFQMRFRFPVFYMSSPLLSSALPAGKQWVKFNLAQLLHREGVNSSLLSSAESDPAQYLQYLKAISGNVQNLGSEQIRGVTTTHYHAVTDLSRSAARLPAGERAAARQALARVEQLTGAKQIPTDVWVDSRHLVRQMRIALSVHPSTGPLSGGQLQEVVSIDLFNFGPKPSASAPPADQTEDFSSVAGSGL